MIKFVYFDLGGVVDLKFVWLVVWLGGLGIIFYYWTPGFSSHSVWLSLGRLAALLGVYQILWQLLLIGRVRWLEKQIGLDHLSRIHHWNGYAAFSLILFHAIAMLYVYGFSILKAENVLKALLALILFIGVIFFSVYIVRRKLKYETWYFVHLFTYLAIILAFAHQLSLGGDLGNPRFALIWKLFYVFAFGNLIIFRFLRPAHLYFRHHFRIIKIVHETSKVTSVYISGTRMKDFQFSPGQFIIVRFLAPGFWWQAHPFSLSQVFDGKTLRLTIKNSGDYTSQINKLKTTTPVIIDGPYGVFTANQSQKDHILLLAGGIGITPIAALAHEFHALQKDTVLIYAVKHPSDIIFAKELAPFHPQLVISSEGQHLNSELLAKLVPDLTRREAYVCGPSLFNKSMETHLKNLGVTRIHWEKFSL